MNRQGQAGLALGISLYSGVIGSLFGVLMLMLLSEPLATVALAFTPMAYFALGVLGLSIVATRSGDSLIKGLIACILGMMVATIGTDPESGVSRFTFNSPNLLGGIAPLLVLVGLFALSDLFLQAAIYGNDERLKAGCRMAFPDRKLARFPPGNWLRHWLP